MGSKHLGDCPIRIFKMDSLKQQFPLKISLPKRNMVCQPLFFNGELLVLGSIGKYSGSKSENVDSRCYFQYLKCPWPAISMCFFNADFTWVSPGFFARQVEG